MNATASACVTGCYAQVQNAKRRTMDIRRHVRHHLQRRLHLVGREQLGEAFLLGPSMPIHLVAQLWKFLAAHVAPIGFDRSSQSAGTQARSTCATRCCSNPCRRVGAQDPPRDKSMSLSSTSHSMIPGADAYELYAQVSHLQQINKDCRHQPTS